MPTGAAANELLAQETHRSYGRAWAKMSPTPAVLAQDVGVDAQSHGRIGMAEAGGDHMDWDAREQQGGCMQVAKIMQPCVGERPGWGE